ncbi:MAG: phosphate/phosphite/phosphonate ABC transporter substrate-binding protein, partial [Gammaproteobacteria bacterium]|nr:phosphate/phosphite/phosphonate ABC transporter substrate-binding protein [Gammaproteobacteria bacterium]
MTTHGPLFSRAFFFLFSLLAAWSAQADLILSSPPRDTQAKEEEIYAPIVDLLTKASGQKVSFKYGENYVIYQSDMLKGKYDIVFDGPQFVGWRIAKLNHVPVAKFPGNLSFVLIARNDNVRIKEPKDLSGRMICAFPPPNLATISILSLYDNPVRQPKIIEVQNFPEAYKQVLSGRCAAGILQAKLFNDL